MPSAPPEEVVPRRRLGGREIPGYELIAAGVLAAVLIVSIVLLPPLAAGGILLVAALGYLLRDWLLRWTTLLFAIAAIVMFVPVRRYALPIPLPFALEPYRVVIALALLAIAIALWRRTLTRAPFPFGWAVGAFMLGLAVSFLANVVSLTQKDLVVGSLGGMLQIAFLLAIAFVVRQLLTSERIVFLLLQFLLWAGVVVAIFAVIERMFKVNYFLLIGNVLPLTLLRDESESLRAGAARAYASSQHPIALAVLLCMLIPIAVYFSQYASRPLHPVSRRLVYGFAIAVLFAGMMTAVSRTGIVVLGVMFLLVVLLRPQISILLMLIALPIGVLGAVLLPSVFESMVLSFIDIDSLIESQYASPGLAGQGRLADLAPAFAEYVQTPFFGTGPGSRIVIGAEANAFILDNQVLGTLLESGVVGVLGLAVLMVGPPLVLLWRVFHTTAAPKYALLGFAIAVSMAGYVAAMFFYDAFSFLQTFMLLMFWFAIGGWLLENRLPRREPEPASEAS